MEDIVDRLRSALSDRYAIERELGAGGMATVYLARDLKHDRQVAIKVLRPELASALGPERFLREIKIAANPRLPHAAQGVQGTVVVAHKEKSRAGYTRLLWRSETET